jgi:hypothetical protein
VNRTARSIARCRQVAGAHDRDRIDDVGRGKNSVVELQLQLAIAEGPVKTCRSDVLAVGVENRDRQDAQR